MELRTLEYFLAIAREENITRAAEHLHITQPSLSRQLKELEEEFGKQLVIRGKRRITLTEDGILLRKRAEEMLQLAERTEKELRNSSASLSGDINTRGTGLTFRLLTPVLELPLSIVWKKYQPHTPTTTRFIDMLTDAFSQ